MIVQIKLFAAARQLTGSDQLQIELPDNADVARLRLGLIQHSPALEQLVRGSLLAVDGEYASDDTPLSAKSEVALIPPVSGG